MIVTLNDAINNINDIEYRTCRELSYNYNKVISAYSLVWTNLNNDEVFRNTFEEYFMQKFISLQNEFHDIFNTFISKTYELLPNWDKSISVPTYNNKIQDVKFSFNSKNEMILNYKPLNDNTSFFSCNITDAIFQNVKIG